MKKFILVAACMVGMGWALHAGETVSAPAGEISNPINADYGGVDISVSSFTVNATTVAIIVSTTAQNPQGTYGQYASTSFANTKTRWRVYGAYFSSGNCGANDYVDVWQSTGGFVAVNSPGAGVNGGATSANIANAIPLRIYNVYNSTGGGGVAGGSGMACSGITPLRWPMRFYGNLYFRPSAATYNSVGLLYWKETD